jgi:hypothetical protein
VVLPPWDTQRNITAALDLLDEKAALHEEISRTTARLRDTLAPVFLTGASLRSG